jgi:hypothetical protein
MASFAIDHPRVIFFMLTDDPTLAYHGVRMSGRIAHSGQQLDDLHPRRARQQRGDRPHLMPSNQHILTSKLEEEDAARWVVADGERRHSGRQGGLVYRGHSHIHT